MYQALRCRGLRVGKERVRVLMQEHGIRGKTKRRYVTTTDSKHLLPVAPNRVQRDFTPGVLVTSPTCPQRKAGCTWQR